MKKGFGVFHVVHIAAFYLLRANTYHCRISCVAELSFLSKAVQNQMTQLFLLLPVMVFTMVVWTLIWVEMIFFCSSRYDVTDILSVTKHMVSHYVNSHISTQHRASVLFLLELLFVRERVLSCPFPLLSADDIDIFLDFIFISWCE